MPRPVPTQESATNHSSRGPSRGCVHQWTFARNRPQNSHFFSLFGPPAVIPTCRDSIRKSFHAKQIRSAYVVFPSEQNTMWDVGPEILISIFAYCSLSVEVASGEQEQTRIRQPCESGTVVLNPGPEPRIHPVAHALEEAVAARPLAHPESQAIIPSRVLSKIDLKSPHGRFQPIAQAHRDTDDAPRFSP